MRGAVQVGAILGVMIGASACNCEQVDRVEDAGPGVSPGAKSAGATPGSAVASAAPRLAVPTQKITFRRLPCPESEPAPPGVKPLGPNAERAAACAIRTLSEIGTCRAETCSGDHGFPRDGIQIVNICELSESEPGCDFRSRYGDTPGEQAKWAVLAHARPKIGWHIRPAVALIAGDFSDSTVVYGPMREAWFWEHPECCRPVGSARPLPDTPPPLPAGKREVGDLFFEVTSCRKSGEEAKQASPAEREERAVACALDAMTRIGKCRRFPDSAFFEGPPTEGIEQLDPFCSTGDQGFPAESLELLAVCSREDKGITGSWDSPAGEVGFSVLVGANESTGKRIISKEVLITVDLRNATLYRQQAEESYYDGDGCRWLGSKTP